MKLIFALYLAAISSPILAGTEPPKGCSYDSAASCDPAKGDWARYSVEELDGDIVTANYTEIRKIVKATLDSYDEEVTAIFPNGKKKTSSTHYAKESTQETRRTLMVFFDDCHDQDAQRKTRHFPFGDVEVCAWKDLMEFNPYYPFIEFESRTKKRHAVLMDFQLVPRKEL